MYLNICNEHMCTCKQKFCRCFYLFYNSIDYYLAIYISLKKLKKKWGRPFARTTVSTGYPKQELQKKQIILNKAW